MSFKYRFNNIFKSVVELTNYSNNLSNNNFIETFSTRKILVCRNNIPKKNVQILIKNLLKNRDNIIKDYLFYLNDDDYSSMTKEELENIKLNILIKPDVNFFKKNQLASVFNLPIHPGALETYEDMGLIKRFVEYKTNLD